MSVTYKYCPLPIDKILDNLNKCKFDIINSATHAQHE